MRWDKLSGIEGGDCACDCAERRESGNMVWDKSMEEGGRGKQHSERCSGGNVSKGRRWVIGDQTEPLLG